MDMNITGIQFMVYENWDKSTGKLYSKFFPSSYGSAIIRNFFPCPGAITRFNLWKITKEVIWDFDNMRIVKFYETCVVKSQEKILSLVGMEED
jgi:hypothetical protein